MITKSKNPYSHHPTDYDTGMLDWWDEGQDIGYDTYPYTLAELLYYSLFNITGSKEEGGGGGDIDIDGYEIFLVRDEDDEEYSVFFDSTDSIFLTKDPNSLYTI